MGIDTIARGLALRGPTVVVPIANDGGANRATIQAALDSGGRIGIYKAGTFDVSDTLVIGSNTHLDLGPQTIIRLANGVQKRLLRNAALANTDVAVTSFASSGTVGTVTRTAHGRAVGDYVAITGATVYGYNGVYRVLTVPDANSYTVSLPTTLATTPATGTLVERSADSNISITGGVWDANGANRTNTGGNEDHGLMLCHVANLHLDTEARHARKFAFLVGNIRDLTTGVLRVQNDYSDGFHLWGPVINADIRGLTGYSTDDFLAFTAGEYASYQLFKGDFHNIKVGYLGGRTPLAGIKITGAVGTLFGDITVDKARLHTGARTVAIVTDTDLQATTVRKVVFNDFEELNPQANSGLIVVNWNGSGTTVIDELILSNINQELASNIVWALVYCVGSATAVEVKRVKFNNVTLKGPTAGATASPRFVEQLGKVTNVFYNNVRAENCQSIFGHNSSGSESGQQLFLNGVQMTGCNIGVSFRRAITVHSGAFQMASSGTAAFSSSTAAAVLTFRGHIECDKANHTNLSGGATVAPYSMTLKMDLANATRVDGGMAYNTNAALGTLGVAGLVSGQGTASLSWKLMSDPTKSY